MRTSLAPVALSLVVSCNVSCNRKSESSSEKPPPYQPKPGAPREVSRPRPPPPPPPGAGFPADGPVRADAPVVRDAAAQPADAAAQPSGPLPLSQQELDAAAAGLKPSLESCTRGQVSGSVQISVTIEPTGQVSAASVAGALPGVQSCLEGVARGMSLRPFAGPSQIRYTIPISW